MDLEIVKLKGVSQTCRDKYCMISHMWNLKKQWWLFFSIWVVCPTLCDPHGLQHTRLLHPPLSPRNLFKFMSLELVIPSDHLILCCPLLLLPSIFPSIRVFSNESALCIRWPKYWSFSFSFSMSPSNEYSGLVSFRIDKFDLLTVQGTLKCL